MASVTVEDTAAYLHESVVRGDHIYKRVWSPTVGEVLQLTCEQRNDHDCFAVYLGGWLSRVAWRVRGASVHVISLSH